MATSIGCTTLEYPKHMRIEGQSIVAVHIRAAHDRLYRDKQPDLLTYAETRRSCIGSLPYHKGSGITIVEGISRTRYVRKSWWSWTTDETASTQRLRFLLGLVLPSTTYPVQGSDWEFRKGKNSGGQSFYSWSDISKSMFIIITVLS